MGKEQGKKGRKSEKKHDWRAGMQGVAMKWESKVRVK